MPCMPNHVPNLRRLPILGAALALAFAATASPAQSQPPSRHSISSGLAKLKAAPPKGEWTFAVLGDSRGGMNVLEAALGKVEQLGPTFSVFTGDLVGESTDREWQGVRTVLDTTVKNVPVFPVVGNHETYAKGIGMFLDVFGNPSPNANGPIDYSFDYGGARFVMMDNSRAGQYGPEGFTDEQIAWLESQLEDAPPLRFVAAHKPPNTRKWEHAFYNNSKAFMALCEKYRVTAAMFGHIHFYDRYQKGGVTYMIAGGAGAPLYHWDGHPDAGNAKIFESPKGVKAHNLVVVKVNGGKASFQAYTDEAKLAKLRPNRSSRIDLTPGDFLPWDSGAFQAAVPATKPAARPAAKPAAKVKTAR